MYALRRHRRHLLFPPGLLALAFLLLLGCVVVGRQAGPRRNLRILQITVPPLAPDSLYLRLAPLVYMPQAELEHFRPWQTVTFTGHTWLDYFSFSQAQVIARQLHDEPEYDRGLRIQFAEHATYASLVQSIDYFNVIGIKKYWLDMRQEPTTLYTFTAKPHGLPVEEGRMMDCAGMVLINYPPLVSPLPLTEQFLAFWAPLLHPAWRNSLVLLLLLALVSGGRLWRQWRRA